MPYNKNFLCCIGAEMANNTTQSTRMSQVYLYRAFEDQTVDDMLSPGFFDSALGVLRKDDLLLLYGPEDPRPRYVYARVQEATRDGIIIEKVNIDARDVFVLTDGFKNLNSNVLQDIITEIDANITYTENRLKQLHQEILEETDRAQAAEGTLSLPPIAGQIPDNLTDGIALLEVENNIIGQEVGKNTSNITTLRKNKVDKTTDCVSPVTDTNKVITQTQFKQLDEKVDMAAMSGTNVGYYWFGKSDASFTPPSPTDIKQNYYDFTTNQIYMANNDLSGWTLDSTYTPPTDKDVNIRITSKFWNIPDQEGQQGGVAYWSYTNQDWGYVPNIISFEDAKLTGTPTTPTPSNSDTSDQIINTQYIANKFVVVDELPETPDEDTFYFVKEQ